MMFDENPENIFIYHYVEEMISSYGEYYKSNFKEVELTLNEFSILLRIRFQGVATQYDLVNLFKVSGAYIAKLLRKFEDMGYVARKEDPKNRRKKLVRITDEGIKKTDELIEVIQNWEDEVTTNISDDELKTLKKILFKIIMTKE
ncbi:MAG: MarR family transcriptional regulator [Methanobrevibacter sp.]|nr:MarR family transcriptional regulator [Methanobrevibacter sp.]